jgi:hypothetical protein
MKSESEIGKDLIQIWGNNFERKGEEMLCVEKHKLLV